MPLSERQDRWRSAWLAIETATPAGWGRNFLASLQRASETSPKGTGDAPQAGDGAALIPSTRIEVPASPRLD